MLWKTVPHISKIYEALTAIADGRFEFTSENTAKCYSSSRNKFYEIEYDPATESIMANDNTSYYTRSLSYPMVAFLMLKDRIEYPKYLLDSLKGYKWKDINKQFKNNFDKAVEFVLVDLSEKGQNREKIHQDCLAIYEKVKSMEFNMLGTLKVPPDAY